MKWTNWQLIFFPSGIHYYISSSAGTVISGQWYIGRYWTSNWVDRQNWPLIELIMNGMWLNKWTEQTDDLYFFYQVFAIISHFIICWNGHETISWAIAIDHRCWTLVSITDIGYWQPVLSDYLWNLDIHFWNYE